MFQAIKNTIKSKSLASLAGRNFSLYPRTPVIDKEIEAQNTSINSLNPHSELGYWN